MFASRFVLNAVRALHIVVGGLSMNVHRGGERVRSHARRYGVGTAHTLLQQDRRRRRCGTCEDVCGQLHADDGPLLRSVGNGGYTENYAWLLCV